MSSMDPVLWYKELYDFKYSYLKQIIIRFQLIVILREINAISNYI